MLILQENCRSSAENESAGDSKQLGCGVFFQSLIAGAPGRAGWGGAAGALARNEKSVISQIDMAKWRARLLISSASGLETCRQIKKADVVFVAHAAAPTPRKFSITL
jgi:hypothetical protein